MLYRQISMSYVYYVDTVNTQVFVVTAIGLYLKFRSKAVKEKLKFIYKYAKPHKFKFILLFSCIIITNFSGSLYPYIFGKLVDEVFYNKNIDKFLWFVGIYGIVYLFTQIMHFVLNMSWASLMTKFLFDIRTAIFNKVLSFKGKKLAEIYSGDIISRMEVDTKEFMSFIHNNVFYFIGGIQRMALAVFFIFYINFWIGIFTIVLTPLVIYISRHFSAKAKKYYREAANKNGLLSSWLFEIIKGMQDIKLLGASKNILTDYVGKTVKIMRLQIKSGKVEVLSERVNSGISIFAQIILYTMSAVFIINGNLTVGGFTACMSYFGTCTMVFNNLNNRIVNISSNMVSVERVMEIFNEESEDYNISSSKTQIMFGNITFHNVWFSYNNDIDVLKNISFKISQGEIISLVGHSGVGKSTIANLIYKLYEVNKGEIYIDDVNINEYNLYSLREQIGIVHQDNIIFDDTIRFNLTFHNDISKDEDEKIWQALKAAHLSDFVRLLPNGLDTIIGAHGIGVSGGQKQRLSITRIFLKNPKILIFDEATSSLDYEAETIIRSSWNKLCKDRTIIIIAHRLSTILGSNKIAVIDNGQIVGFDNHTALLQSCRTYSELFREQYGHFEVDTDA